jgi:hypothetical protein
VTSLVNNNNSSIKIQKQYGPIVVKPRTNPAPTLKTGRKSMYIKLSAEEEEKRDKRRSRNRHAAEKCKQKRTEIEEKLEINLKNLMAEQKSIQLEKQKLLEEKLHLEKVLKQQNDSIYSSNYLFYDYNNPFHYSI